jgi:hypothetical protein
MAQTDFAFWLLTAYILGTCLIVYTLLCGELDFHRTGCIGTSPSSFSVFGFLRCLLFMSPLFSTPMSTDRSHLLFMHSWVGLEVVEEALHFCACRKLLFIFIMSSR